MLKRTLFVIVFPILLMAILPISVGSYILYGNVDKADDYVDWLVDAGL